MLCLERKKIKRVSELRQRDMGVRGLYLKGKKVTNPPNTGKRIWIERD